MNGNLNHQKVIKRQQKVEANKKQPLRTCHKQTLANGSIIYNKN